MDLNYPQHQQTTHHDLVGTGRSYECIFCKRGFTTAQALGGHMNIHRKQRANNNNTNIKPSTSSNKVDADLLQHPTQSTALTVTPSHAQLFLQDWRTTNFTFYSNPLSFHEIKNKLEDTQENGLDLELRLGHHP
ncbi:transcriptional regulator TAC1-like [Vigna unguiculata]|uniref:C2H2-type domain-containing protein n=1 Tax=Vigna unguiculata TaxID=3917 RepID=A0A4D6MBD0_VIGUN|nr:transcriptional regulator TAC1-like [Vigna unguiculata]QCD97721.1 hypothetical protein DEO72_LG6g2433 [Vigna unguiculata]